MSVCGRFEALSTGRTSRSDGEVWAVKVLVAHLGLKGRLCAAGQAIAGQDFVLAQACCLQQSPPSQLSASHALPGLTRAIARRISRNTDVIAVLHEV